MASLEKTEAKLANLGGRVCLGFAFLVAVAKFSSSGDLGHLLFQKRTFVKEVRPTLDDSMEGSVDVCTS